VRQRWRCLTDVLHPLSTSRRRPPKLKRQHIGSEKSVVAADLDSAYFACVFEGKMITPRRIPVLEELLVSREQ